MTYPDLVILLNDQGRSVFRTWSEPMTAIALAASPPAISTGRRPRCVRSNYRLQPNQLWVNDGRVVRRMSPPISNTVATSPGFPGGHSIGRRGVISTTTAGSICSPVISHIVDGRGDQPKSRFLRNLGPEKNSVRGHAARAACFIRNLMPAPPRGISTMTGDLDSVLHDGVWRRLVRLAKPSRAVSNYGRFTFSDVTTPQTRRSAADLSGRLGRLRSGRRSRSRHGGKAVREPGPRRAIGSAVDVAGRRQGGESVGDRPQVRIRYGDQTLTRQVEAGTGEGNQNDLTFHFGLGERDCPRPSGSPLAQRQPAGRQARRDQSCDFRPKN